MDLRREAAFLLGGTELGSSGEKDVMGRAKRAKEAGVVWDALGVVMKGGLRPQGSNTPQDQRRRRIWGDRGAVGLGLTSSHTARPRLHVLSGAPPIPGQRAGEMRKGSECPRGPGALRRGCQACVSAIFPTRDALEQTGSRGEARVGSAKASLWGVRVPNPFVLLVALRQSSHLILDLGRVSRTVGSKWGESLGDTVHSPVYRQRRWRPRGGLGGVGRDGWSSEG